MRQFSPVPAEPEPKCVDCGVKTSDYDADEPDWKDGLFPDGEVLHKYSDGYGCKPCSNGKPEHGIPWDDAESSPIDDVRRAADHIYGQVSNFTDTFLRCGIPVKRTVEVTYRDDGNVKSVNTTVRQL